MKSGAGLLVAATLVLSGCSTSTAGRGAVGPVGSTLGASSHVHALPSGSPDAADAAAADRLARAAFDQLGDQVPALYVGIWDPKRGVFVHAYGHAVRGGRPASVSDSFRIASITKTFTATVVLQLIAAGRLNLSTTVGNALPDVAARHPDLRRITVDELLGMRSGLPDYLNDPHGIAADIAANPERVWSETDLVDAALRLPVAPAGSSGYSNTNYVLLGLIVEKVTGSSLATLIHDRLARPLGLAHTVLPPASDTALPEPAAHGYLNDACLAKAAEAGAPHIDPSTDTTMWNTSYFQGAGGMISTVADLGRWGATTLGTDLLPTDLAAQRLDARDIGDIAPYGLGIKRFGAWYGHDGDAFGWDSLAVHNPTTGVTFVAAANACTGLTTAFLDLLANLYPDQPTH